MIQAENRTCPQQRDDAELTVTVGHNLPGLNGFSELFSQIIWTHRNMIIDITH